MNGDFGYDNLVQNRRTWAATTLILLYVVQHTSSYIWYYATKCMGINLIIKPMCMCRFLHIPNAFPHQYDSPKSRGSGISYVYIFLLLLQNNNLSYYFRDHGWFESFWRFGWCSKVYSNWDYLCYSNDISSLYPSLIIVWIQSAIARCLWWIFIQGPHGPLHTLKTLKEKVGPGKPLNILTFRYAPVEILEHPYIFYRYGHIFRMGNVCPCRAP